MSYNNINDFIEQMKVMAVYQERIDKTRSIYSPTPTEIAVLGYLRNSDKREIPRSELAFFGESIGRTDSSISTATKNLHREGFITRKKNPSDQREGVVRLEQIGRNYCRALEKSLEGTKEKIEIMKKGGF